MRVDSESYRRFRFRTLVRGLLLLCAGSLVSVFAMFWLVIGIVAFFVSDPYPILNGLLFTVLGGLVPGLGAALLLLRAATTLRKRARMGRLVGLVSHREPIPFDEVVAALRLAPLVVEDLVIEGVRHRIFARADLASFGSSSQAQASVAPSPGYSPALAQATSVSPAAQISPAAMSSVRPPAVGAPAAQAAGWQPSTPPPMSATALAQALLGRVVLGTYHIEAHLGTGGMGAVFRARHTRTGRRYAFKILLPDAHIAADALKRFEREATAASALGHPGLVAVHDFNRTEEGLAFLVMDLLEGETLLQRLERYGSLPWAAAQRIVLEIGDALACAHEHGLLHRDVKPANIFLAQGANGNERAVLLDFGLVKPVQQASRSRVTASGVAVGTPLYMSPEQARGEPIDQRSDLYSLAAVLYEVLTGTPVFFDTTLPAVYARLLNDPAPKISSVVPSAGSLGLDDVFARALAKDPRQRPPAVRAFMAEIARIRVAQGKATVVLG